MLGRHPPMKMSGSTLPVGEVQVPALPQVVWLSAMGAGNVQGFDRAMPLTPFLLVRCLPCCIICPLLLAVASLVYILSLVHTITSIYIHH